MSDEIETTGKLADATKEIAKTAGKGIDAGSDFGKWLNDVLGDFVKDGVGLYQDRLKYFRQERAIDLHLKHLKFLKNRGVERLRPIPPKILLPIFENATVEENESLHDLWANLLASARDADSEEVQKSFASILAELTPKDAELLQEVEERWFKAIVPEALRSDTDTTKPREAERCIGFSNFKEFEISLTNLERLGLIREANFVSQHFVLHGADGGGREI